MIRLLLPNEALQLQKLRLLSLQTDPDAFVSTYEYESLHSDTYYFNRIRNTTVPPYFGYWGIFIDNNLVAYAQLSRDQLPKASHLANIYEVYVASQNRHQSLGTTLITHLVNLCIQHPDIEQVFLKTSSTNTPAINLYKKVGFSLVATREKTIKYNNKYQDELVFKMDTI